MNPMLSKVLFTIPTLLQLHKCGETEVSFLNEELNLTQTE